MEDLGGSQLDGLGTTIRKKRSQTSRRPRPEPQVFSDSHDLSPLSSLPLSDDLSKVSSDEHTGDANFSGKMFSLNQCMSRGPSICRDEDAYIHKKIKKEDGGTGAPQNNGNNGDLTDNGRTIPPESQIMAVDGLGNENKLKKVKLKVGGVTRTIQAKSSSNAVSNIGISTKTSKPLDGPRAKQKLSVQDIVDHPLPDKKSSLPGNPWKDYSRGKLHPGKEENGKMSAKNGFDKASEKLDSVRKSKRVPKRRVLDGAFDEDEDDDELRYLEKIRIPKGGSYREFDDELTKKQKISRSSKGGNYETLDEGTRPTKDGKKSRSDRGSEDTDFEDEEEMVSDSEHVGKKKKLLKDPSGSPPENKREITLTTRQRALLSSKDASSAGACQIEFPNGLPPPQSRKQKEQLTEVEQQVKKAEAAQRRRMQNEKAAREIQEEAIRKVLGQESSRKKREDKIKKRQEELAQEKAANALLNAASTIRWVMGPTGTCITFPDEMGFPKIFDPKPSGYPAPREKCAGPSCNNPYKYRDSKTKQPLCSLKCYKAIHTAEC